MNSVGELRLCRFDSVKEGEVVRVDVDGRPPLAVYRIDGQVPVTNDTCSHSDASLADGIVEGGQIECPYHGARFCIRTGEALTSPAASPLRVYAAVVKDGDVFIQPEGNQT